MEPILSARDVSFAYDNYEEKQTAAHCAGGRFPGYSARGVCGSTGAQWVGEIHAGQAFQRHFAAHWRYRLRRTALTPKQEDRLYDIRQTVGMVFQNPDNQLVATIVEEDVAFAPENLGVPPEEIRRRVDDAVESGGHV